MKIFITIYFVVSQILIFLTNKHFPNIIFQHPKHIFHKIYFGLKSAEKSVKTMADALDFSERGH